MRNDIKEAKRLLSHHIEELLRTLGIPPTAPGELGDFHGESLTIAVPIRVDDNRVQYQVCSDGVPIACLEVAVNWKQ